ncbi:MAG: acetolactate decarboxylase [Sneathiella sp.]|uniref:acetolactate decarboxylase n=1 Tax=Sneathiella sp. TaxID=1964365 RepID=UPI0030017DD7
MQKQLNCRVSESVWSALQKEVERTGDSLSHILEKTVSTALGLEHHSIFQVSTSGALVQGVFQGCTRVSDLKSHGDFGLGTFDNLDGEMVMLDGRCYQAGADGITREAEDDWTTPFATVTRFETDQTQEIPFVGNIGELEQFLNSSRPSENIFVGVRLEGFFEKIDLRAACKAHSGEDLVAATAHQSEFTFENIEGTLVGFWSPEYAKTLNISGYHLHFISKDLAKGGHLMKVKARDLTAMLHFETDLHIAIPETEAFLQADLNTDPTEALNIADKTSSEER